MNKTLAAFARREIKDGLKKLPECWQHNFKLMYAKRKDLPIDQVVDNMDDEKLDWALTQVENSLMIKRDANG